MLYSMRNRNGYVLFSPFMIEASGSGARSYRRLWETGCPAGLSTKRRQSIYLIFIRAGWLLAALLRGLTLVTVTRHLDCTFFLKTQRCISPIDSSGMSRVTESPTNYTITYPEKGVNQISQSPGALSFWGLPPFYREAFPRIPTLTWNREQKSLLQRRTKCPLRSRGKEP